MFTRADIFLAVKPLLPRWLRDRLRLLYQHAGSFIRYGDWHMFQSISLEISVFCNRTCSYCPNVDHETPKEFMPEHVFAKALLRLKELRWRGIVDFIFYNEPLLDKTLEEKVRRIKRACPGALPRVTTNGDALTEALLLRLVDAGVVSFYVTRHGGQRLSMNSWSCTDFVRGAAAARISRSTTSNPFICGRSWSWTRRTSSLSAR